MFKHYKNLIKNRSAIDRFSFGLLILLFLILCWVIYDKHNNYLINNHNVAETAVKNTTTAIQYALQSKKRILDSFVSDHQAEIIELINAPDSHELFDNLHTRLKRVLPDLFTINLATPDGSLIIDDFDGFTGGMCIDDLKSFVHTDLHLKRTHPNNILYHHDEISAFVYDQHTYLFFASFSLNEIVKTLRFSTPEGNNLILINQDQENLIEITRSGGRDKIRDRLDFRLTGSELSSITSQSSIPDTHWTVVNLQDSDKMNQHLSTLIIPAALIFMLVSAVILFMRKAINHNFEQLQKVSSELIIRNSEVTKLNYELENLSLTDTLTGLNNRRYFDQQFEKEWNRATRDKVSLSVMMIDIDYFKKYNDTYGHIEGDNCIRIVAQILNSCISRSNEFVARYGGEEFCAVVSGTSDVCLKIAESIHQKLADACIEHNQSDFNHVSASIGIADLIPGPSYRPQMLTERADIALYQAKKNGRNCTVVYSKNITNNITRQSN